MLNKHLTCIYLFKFPSAEKTHLWQNLPYSSVASNNREVLKLFPLHNDYVEVQTYNP